MSFTLNLGAYNKPQAPLKETIRGVIEKILYSSDSKTSGIMRYGFILKSKKKVTVPRLGKPSRNTQTVTVFAEMRECVEGGYVELTGHWGKPSEKYDASFNADSCIYKDDDEMGAKSMLVFCFGEKTASKIVDAFDGSHLDAWNCFKTDHEGFLLYMEDVRGVGPKKINKARQKYEDNMAMEVLYARFGKNGMSLEQAMKIYEKFGDRTLSIIEENPYSISKYTGFLVADKIARVHYKVEDTDTRRLQSAVLFAMNQQELGGGHTFMALEQRLARRVPTLLEYATALLKKSTNRVVEDSYIRDAVILLTNKKKLFLDKQEDKTIVYLPKFYHAEVDLAKKLKTMIGSSDLSDNEIDDFIDQYEVDKQREIGSEFKLADLQREAIHTACKNQFSIISGPPGSGKTTIIDCIVSLLEHFKKEVDINLCAPTGKAATRMSESTGRPASTVHRLLHYDPQLKDFKYNADNHLDADVIIVDECSMIGVCLANSLIAACKESAKVIFVGDKDQLPSVDAGKVLEDLLSVDSIPKVILNKVFRQGEKSPILDRALTLSGTKTGTPQMPCLDDTPDEDFLFYEYNDLDDHGQPIEKNLNTIRTGGIKLYKQEVEKYGIENVLFLIPMNKRELGCNAMNELLQEAVNPADSSKRSVKVGKRIFREGDRVIQLENEDEHQVFNGMVGTVERIFKDPENNRDVISVDFGNDLVVEYQRDRFDKIKLAYALTVHKCQGSEAKSVIMFCLDSQRIMNTKKLIYTAWTRAKNKLQIIGSRKVINRAITVQEATRLSRLRYRLMY